LLLLDVNTHHSINSVWGITFLFFPLEMKHEWVHMLEDFLVV